MDAESTVAGLGAWASACTEDIRAAMRIDFLKWDVLWLRLAENLAETARPFGGGECIVLGGLCVFDSRVPLTGSMSQIRSGRNGLAVRRGRCQGWLFLMICLYLLRV